MTNNQQSTIPTIVFATSTHRHHPFHRTDGGGKRHSKALNKCLGIRYHHGGPKNLTTRLPGGKFAYPGRTATTLNPRSTPGVFVKTPPAMVEIAGYMAGVYL